MMLMKMMRKVEWEVMMKKRKKAAIATTKSIEKKKGKSEYETIQALLLPI